MGSNSHRAHSFILPLRGPERKVAELINYNQYCWRMDRIRHLFLPHEVYAILYIHINPALPADQLV